MKTIPSDSPIRLRLPEAAASLLLEKGFSGALIDTLCLREEVTQGAFFHHVSDQEALAG